MRIRICVVVLLSMSMCLQSRAFSQGQREIVGDGKGRLVSQPVNVVSSVPEAAAYLSGVSELEQIPEEEMENGGTLQSILFRSILSEGMCWRRPGSCQCTRLYLCWITGREVGMSCQYRNLGLSMVSEKRRRKR